MATQESFDRAAAERMVAKIRQAYEKKDARALEALAHPDEDPRSRQSSREYEQDAMDLGYQVASATIKPYKQPPWGIFKTEEFYPPPVFSIELTLRRSDGGTTERYYACAPHDDGYCTCHYRARPKPAKKPKAARDKAPAPPPPLDFEKLAAALGAAVQAAVPAFLGEHPRERFYAFSLYSDDEAGDVRLAANSEESLARQMAKAGAKRSEESGYRWSPSEWEYQSIGEEAFGPAHEILNASPGIGEKGIAAYRRKLIAAMTEALADADGMGVFETGGGGRRPRDQFTLFVSLIDSEETEKVEDASAKKLNPPSVAKRFLARGG